jgi:hypothetical protein
LATDEAELMLHQQPLPLQLSQLQGGIAACHLGLVDLKIRGDSALGAALEEAQCLIA